MAKKKTGKFSSFLNNPFDFTLVITILLLLGIGLVMVLSASSPSALSESGNSYAYFSKQLIDRSSSVQKTLLSKAIKLLKPGHEMVYSTCSILSCENEDIVAHSIKNENVEIVPIHFEGMEELPLLPTKINGTLCICPTELYEGFFVAKIRKN